MSSRAGLKRFDILHGDSTRVSNLRREILAQPLGIERTVRMQAEQIKELVGIFEKAKAAGLSTIDIVAAGSSRNAASIGTFAMRRSINPLPYFVIQDPSLYQQTSPILILVSQSGESKDLLDLLRKLEGLRHDFLTIALTNTPESSLATRTNMQLFTYAEKEESIAATGTMTAAVVSFFHLLAAINHDQHMMRNILGLPERLNDFLSAPYLLPIDELTRQLREVSLITFLGQDILSACAAEMALKVGETADAITISETMAMYKHGYGAPYGARTKPLASVGKAMFILSRGTMEESRFTAYYRKLLERSNSLFREIRFGTQPSSGDKICLPAASTLEEAVLSLAFSHMLAHDLAAEKGIAPGTSEVLSKFVA